MALTWVVAIFCIVACSICLVFCIGFVWRDRRAAKELATASAGNALGSVLASLGRPTIGIGLDPIRSAV